MESEDEGVIGGDPCRPEEARLQDLEADNSRLRSQLNVKDQEIEELNTKVRGLLVSYSRSYFGPPLRIIPRDSHLGALPVLPFKPWIIV